MSLVDAVIHRQDRNFGKPSGIWLQPRRGELSACCFEFGAAFSAAASDVSRIFKIPADNDIYLPHFRFFFGVAFKFLMSTFIVIIKVDSLFPHRTLQYGYTPLLLHLNIQCTPYLDHNPHYLLASLTNPPSLMRQR